MCAAGNMTSVLLGAMISTAMLGSTARRAKLCTWSWALTPMPRWRCREVAPTLAARLRDTNLVRIAPRDTHHAQVTELFERHELKVRRSGVQPGVQQIVS